MECAIFTIRTREITVQSEKRATMAAFTWWWGRRRTGREGEKEGKDIKEGRILRKDRDGMGGGEGRKGKGEGRDGY